MANNMIGNVQKKALLGSKTLLNIQCDQANTPNSPRLNLGVFIQLFNKPAHNLDKTTRPEERRLALSIADNMPQESGQ